MGTAALTAGVAGIVYGQKAGLWQAVGSAAHDLVQGLGRTNREIQGALMGAALLGGGTAVNSGMREMKMRAKEEGQRSPAELKTIRRKRLQHAVGATVIASTGGAAGGYVAPPLWDGAVRVMSEACSKIFKAGVTGLRARPKGLGIQFVSDAPAGGFWKSLFRRTSTT
ncbi:MAG TPA: hypothetical protein VEY30_09340 [Myxococcaceae bacterium]|nr:hypothetical protein [Myxococcaceae bacterium]